MYTIKQSQEIIDRVRYLSKHDISCMLIECADKQDEQTKKLFKQWAHNAYTSTCDEDIEGIYKDITAHDTYIRELVPPEVWVWLGGELVVDI